MTADARHAFRNHNAREATAIIERLIADAHHAGGNRDAREATATTERIIADARHAVFDDYCFDAILVTVPRRKGSGIVFHFPRSANRQHTGFGIKRPCQVSAAGAAVSLGRRRQDEKRRQGGGDDGDGQAYKQ